MSEAFQVNPSALEDPWSVPLSELDPSQPSVFQTNNQFALFDRLRAEDPVHFHETGLFGPYWSITKFNDIMTVDKDHKRFSSDAGITLTERQADFTTPNFISMDPPKHDVQRKAVTGVVAPMNLSKLEPIIRQRAVTILESLPHGEQFNWVDAVSIELTTQMLATLFDFPFEDRRKLTYWSDMATSGELAGGPTPEADRRAAMLECLEYFQRLWREREGVPPEVGIDLDFDDG